MTLLMAFAPSAAFAAASCAYDGTTGIVSVQLAQGGDSATFRVGGGGALLVNGATCSGATVTNTESVSVVDVSTGATSVTFDLGGGPFAPGATNELGDSDEIEFTVDQGEGNSDSLAVRGRTLRDVVRVGEASANLNADEGDEIDADVTFVGTESVSLDGLGDNDDLSAAGGAGTGQPATLALTLLGGNGTDRLAGGIAGDLFDGGAGFDTADYGDHAAGVVVSIGTGSGDDGHAGEGDTVLESVESVFGGPAGDTLAGDTSAELLAGGDGNDSLDGNGGDDELRGENGEDLLDGDANDDLLFGGMGNDEERGGGFNDVFVPMVPTTYSTTTATPLLDRGLTTIQFPVGGAPTTIYDTNIRLDVEHPATQHLTITLVHPDGVTRNRLIAAKGNGSPMRGTVFDSEAVTNIRNLGAKPLEGRFHPDGSMEIFDSMNPNGTWTLEVNDSTAGSLGTVNGFTLQFTFANPTSDGDDVMSGGGGVHDLVDVFGRTQPVTATMMGGADDGQAGEADNIGAGLADIEDLYGGVNGDNITGTDDANDIRGMIGSDTISTLGGVDVIRGRQGDDTINGGIGNDTINGGTGGDAIIGGPGSDWASYTGAPGAMTIDLGAGVGSGGDGNDTYAELENVTGTDFDDDITGSAAINWLEGGTGNDTLRGAAGNDTLEGKVGNDTIIGGPGNDWARYGKSPAAVTVDLVAGTATGGEGSDTISETEFIFGSPHADMLTGSDLFNHIKGEGGNDTLSALAANDILEGGAGSDSLDGGLGTDTCRTGESLVSCEK
ncbi:MAG: proprotein convertase P-domain-containing protein [Actinomycetota bacterium]|nr:proprotein convertase P-domain-containing protein [Actinomycetota bacterium]